VPESLRRLKTASASSALLLVLPLFVALLAAPTAAVAAPALQQVQAESKLPLEAEPAVVDFGDVLGGEPTRATVKITNVSNSPVPVKQVKTSCGCTVATVHGPDGAELPARPPKPDMLVATLEPGQSLTVDVQMETATTQGLVEKHLQIYTSDGSAPLLQVPVKARVSKAFSISPDKIDLRNVARSGRVEQTLVVQAQSIGDWTIEGFESGMDGNPLPAWLQLSVLDTEGLSRRVQLVSDGPRPVGAFMSKVRIKIGHEKVKSVDFSIFGIVRPDVVFDTGSPTAPDSVSFDQMSKGDLVTRTVKVLNNDPGVPYQLKSVDVQVPAHIKPMIQSTINTLQDGVSYEIVLTAKADMPEPFFRGTLLLIAEHPDLPRHPLTFHGWVKQQQ
jgi:hypothetical protein